MFSVKNIYRHWFPHWQYCPWLLLSLARLTYVLCVYLCLGGCVLAHECVDFLSSCLLFLPQLYILTWWCWMVPLRGAKAWLLPSRSLCRTKIKSSEWLTHGAAGLKSIMDSLRKECVCVFVGKTWDKGLSRCRMGNRKKKRTELRTMKRKSDTGIGCTKWMGAEVNSVWLLSKGSEGYCREVAWPGIYSTL